MKPAPDGGTVPRVIAQVGTPTNRRNAAAGAFPIYRMRVATADGGSAASSPTASHLRAVPSSIHRASPAACSSAPRPLATRPQLPGQAMGAHPATSSSIRPRQVPKSTASVRTWKAEAPALRPSELPTNDSLAQSAQSVSVSGECTSSEVSPVKGQTLSAVVSNTSAVLVATAQQTKHAQLTQLHAQLQVQLHQTEQQQAQLQQQVQLQQADQRQLQQQVQAQPTELETPSMSPNRNGAMSRAQALAQPMQPQQAAETDQPTQDAPQGAQGSQSAPAPQKMKDEYMENKNNDDELRQRLRSIAERHRGGSASILTGALQNISARANGTSSLVIPQRSTSLGGWSRRVPSESSPAVRSPSGTECSAEGSRAAHTERQLHDLRSRIQAFQNQHQKRQPLKAQSEATEMSTADAEPERTGIHEQMATPVAGPLETDLLWVVKQMEVHRKQIQFHQEHLSALEKRHAELLVAVSSRTQSLGAGRGSPTASSIAESKRPLPQDDPEGDQQEEDASGYLATLAVVDSRLGVRRNRPGSSSSTSAHSNAASRTRESGARSASLDAVGASTRDASTGSRHRSSEDRQFSSSPQSKNSVSPDSHSCLSARHPPNSLDLGPAPDSALPEAERVAALLRQLHRVRPPTTPFVLLGSSSGDEEGVSYLHGSLEVRLRPSEDGRRLLIRMWRNGNNDDGVLDIGEYLVRVDTAESKKVGRPNTIVEETEFTDGNYSNSSPRPLFDVPVISRTGSVASSVGPAALSEVNYSTEMGPLAATVPGVSARDGPPPPPASTQWSDLFKSHWSAR